MLVDAVPPLISKSAKAQCKISFNPCVEQKKNFTSSVWVSFHDIFLCAVPNTFESQCMAEKTIRCHATLPSHQSKNIVETECKYFRELSSISTSVRRHYNFKHTFYGMSHESFLSRPWGLPLNTNTCNNDYRLKHKFILIVHACQNHNSELSVSECALCQFYDGVHIFLKLNLDTHTSRIIQTRLTNNGHFRCCWKASLVTSPCASFSVITQSAPPKCIFGNEFNHALLPLA